MTAIDKYEQNRQILFDTIYSLDTPFTASELEEVFLRRLPNGFHEVDRTLSLRDLLRELEIYGLLKKEGAYYQVIDVLSHAG